MNYITNQLLQIRVPDENSTKSPKPRLAADRISLVGGHFQAL